MRVILHKNVRSVRIVQLMYRLALFAENFRDSGPSLFVCYPLLARLRTQTSCTRDPNSNLVFFHLPFYLTCPSFPSSAGVPGITLQHTTKDKTVMRMTHLPPTFDVSLLAVRPYSQPFWSESGSREFSLQSSRLLNRHGVVKRLTERWMRRVTGLRTTRSGGELANSCWA